jgi:riboflavin synthase
MFSGIVEELGQVKEISRSGNITFLAITAKKIVEDIKIGDSISVNGTCLTLVKKQGDVLSFEVIAGTSKKTNLGNLHVSDKVNLERSLKVGDRLSGHFVSGHIDCMGNIRRKTYVNGNLCFEIAVPVEFTKYCNPQGAIAVDGVGLTIVKKKGNVFLIYIIPHTLKNTTLGFRKPSDKVNIEFDILAKNAVN